MMVETLIYGGVFLKYQVFAWDQEITAVYAWIGLDCHVKHGRALMGFLRCFLSEWSILLYDDEMYVFFNSC